MMRRPPQAAAPRSKGAIIVHGGAPAQQRRAQSCPAPNSGAGKKKGAACASRPTGLWRAARRGVASSAVAVLGRRARRINSTGTGPRGRCSRSAPAPPPIYYQSSPAGPPPLPAELPARTAHDAHVTTATRHAHKHRQRLRSHATVRSRSATRLCAGRARRTATEVTVRSQQGAGCLRA
jgi:hypothetical protein